ncbi:MAG: TetR family transcriptional regulator [Solirubrobacterales bacterium]|nr:TetR family transcriptional regulator [Solirubrobacterales bacterium]
MEKIVKRAALLSAGVPEFERRTQLLQAAAELVEAQGLGALSHRAVEQAAGVPHGSVTYWFGSRDGLITALVNWLCEQSERQCRALAAQVEESLREGGKPDVDVLARGMSEWHASPAAMHLARLELELQGAREPAHAARMTAAAGVFWEMCATLARVLGSDDPERDGRTMAVLLDGVLLDALAHPPQDLAVLETAIRWVLQGAATRP